MAFRRRRGPAAGMAGPSLGQVWGHQDSLHCQGRHGAVEGKLWAGDDAVLAAAVLGTEDGGGFLAISSD